MISVIILIIIGVIVVGGGVVTYVVVSSEGAKAFDGTYLTYEDSVRGIKIEYPSNWEVNNDSYLTFASPKENKEDKQENLEVVVKDVTSFGDVTLQDVSDDSVVNAKAFTVGHPEDFSGLEDTTLAGLPAGTLSYSAEFTMREFGKERIDRVKYMWVWTLKDSRTYSLIYMGAEKDYDKYLEIINHMVESFEIVES